MAETIKVHTENSTFQRFEVLKTNRYKRHKYGEFFVEGVRNINEAITNHWLLNAFLYTTEKPLSHWAADILAQSTANFHYELPMHLMSKLSSKEDSSELIAILGIPDDTVDRIGLSPNPLIVVFDRPSNKGNLGTVIRSCDALGCDGLVVTGHAVDLYEPETVGASVGSFFKLPSVRMPSHKELLLWVQEIKESYTDLQIVGSSAKGDVNIDQCDFSRPTILLIGNETDGLSRAYKESCDTMCRIPIGGSASSLNVSCAASIALYEVSRQRNATLHL